MFFRYDAGKTPNDSWSGPTGPSVRACDPEPQNGVQLLSLPPREPGGRQMLVQIHDVLQAVEVGGTIGAPLEMVPDPPVRGRMQPAVELVLNVPCDVGAGDLPKPGRWTGHGGRRKKTGSSMPKG